MKLFHKILIPVIVTILLVSSIGCGEDKLSADEKGIRIKVIVKKRDASFWTVVKMGAEAAGKEFGVGIDFDGPIDEQDIDLQIEMVDGAIREKADAIVLAACDYTRLVNVAEKAVSEGIPVIIIDSDIHSAKMNSFIGTNNVDAGKLLAETLIEEVGENSKIAVMSFVKGAASSDQRDEGLYDVLGNHSSIEILESMYCYSDESVAEKLTKELVQQYPDVDAIVCTNAYGTVGTARAISQMDLAGSVKIIGFDSTPEEVSFVEKGVIQSLVIQNPFSMGYLGVKYALNAINKEVFPKLIYTESKVINKSNMYQPVNQKLVFPFTD